MYKRAQGVIAENPYAAEQGIFSRGTGNFLERNREGDGWKPGLAVRGGSDELITGRHACLFRAGVFPDACELMR
jgi:hypothetical protein